jgi:UDP-N-acetylmuramate dehydrogenase
MRIETNVDLSRFTTFHMGGIAKKMIIPESEDELLEVINNQKLPRYIIGGGSNLLINDKREFDTVISLREFNKEIIDLGNGRFYSGASVRLQKLIKTINDSGYGGIEYLYSVPGLVGGAVVMNAGRGNSKDEIKNYVISVRVIKDGIFQEVEGKDCEFKRRSSIFKNSDVVVVGATFSFKPGKPSDFAGMREDRIKHVKVFQDTSKPNFGTVFFKADPYIMKIIQKTTSERAKGVHYSKKTSNWLLNDNGSFNEAIRELEKVRKIHVLLHRPCEREVIIWK